MSPVVTVLIPVYNGANYLKEAIQSVLEQTYTDYELLIVDDGSTDDTSAIISSFENTKPGQIRGIFQPNKGTASALNVGIRAARGEYIAWLSHDDRFHPDKLAIQLACLNASPSLDGVYTDYALIDPAGEPLGTVHSVGYPPAKMMRHLMQAVFINGSTLMVRRSCLEEAGLFDETVRYAHDALAWVHLSHKCTLRHLGVPLTEYRIHPGQGTRKRRTIRADNYLWLSKVIDAYDITDFFPELLNDGARTPHWAAAHTYMGDVFARRYRQLGLAFGQYLRALKVWPSPSNPALVRAVIGPLQAVLGKLTDVVLEVTGGSRTRTQSGDVNMEYWASVIPDVDIPESRPADGGTVANG